MALPFDLLERVRSASPKVEGARWAETVSRYREALELKLRGVDAPVRRKVVDGFLWHIPYADRGLGRLIARSRRLPTMFEIEQARRLGAHGHTMVDIGANVGTTSIPRVALGYFSRAVVAEPADVDFRCLVQNVVANRLRGRVLPDNCAIYSHTGTVRFRQQEQSGVHRVSAKDKDGEAPSFTLDDWLDQRGIRPRQVDFVKSDAQGSEGHVFAGAEDLLRLRRAIWQIEYWPKGLHALGTSEAELQDQLREWFTDFVLLGRRGDGNEDPVAHPIVALTDTIEELALGPRGFTNLLLYPTSRAAIRGGASS